MAPRVLTPRELINPEVLSRLVEFRVQEETGYNISALAPIQSVTRTSVKLNVRSADISRIGQFRADNALTPISIPPTIGRATLELEMPLLSEKEILRERRIKELRSADTEVAQEAARIILNQAVRLRQQNINLTKFMVFRAAQDALTITYPDGEALDIDYGLENADVGMSATHLPTAGVLWSAITTADPRSDVDAWSKLITDDQGASQDQITMWITTDVWRNLQDNTKVQQLVGTVAEPLRPTRVQQVADIFGLKTIQLYDDTVKDRTGTAFKLLPITKALFVGPTQNGQPIIEVEDGPVARWDNATQDIVVANNAGAVSEIWAQADPLVRNVRVTTARIPLVLREGLVCATVR